MDGSQPIVGGGYYGYSVDFDGSIRNDYELITRYREMVMNLSVIVQLMILLTKQFVETLMMYQLSWNFPT